MRACPRCSGLLRPAFDVTDDGIDVFQLQWLRCECGYETKPRRKKIGTVAEAVAAYYNQEESK